MSNLSNKKLFFQFGGQGVPWLSELLFLKSSGKILNFLSAVKEAFQEEMPNIQKYNILPLKFDVDYWLSGEPVENSDYLMYSAVSLPMIFVTHLARLEYFAAISGCKTEEFLQSVVGISGHSQGVIAGCLLSLTKDREKQYYSNLKTFIKYMLYLGLRAQEVFPSLEPTEKELEITKALPGGRRLKPYPMVAVLGVKRDFLQPLIDSFNQNLDENQQIYLTLYNSPTNSILSSTRASLVSFHEHIASYIEEKKLKYVYLKASCPFHCQYMEPIVEPILKDCENIGFDYHSSDLSIPVYSFEDGENIQNKNIPLNEFLCRTLMTETLYWSQALTSIHNRNIVDAILDFGPGKAIVGFTQEILSANNIHHLPIYPIVNVKDEKTAEKVIGIKPL